MPDESWSEEVVDGINKALKSAHGIAEETYGNNQHSEVVEIDVNIGSPWRTVPNFTGTRIGADPGPQTMTSSCRYMKHYDGSVEFQGGFLGTSAGYPATYYSPHTVMTLAPSLRPVFDSIFPIFGQQNPLSLQATPAYATISRSSGIISVTGSDGTGLAGAAVSAPAFFYLNFRFMAADPRPYIIPGFPISFNVKCKEPPVGVIPIACVEQNQKVVRPGPMLGSADWKFSKKDGHGVITISNLAYSGFNNRITVWFLVIYK